MCTFYVKLAIVVLGRRPSMLVNDCPFLPDVRMAEALFYSPYLDPIQIPKNHDKGT